MINLKLNGISIIFSLHLFIPSLVVGMSSKSDTTNSSKCLEVMSGKIKKQTILGTKTETELIPGTKEFFDHKKNKIKTLFVGQDEAIEGVFNQMETWYLHPETRFKPTVITLWGMTGTGKTSLIRDIVHELSLDSGFYYLDMGKFSAQNTDSSVPSLENTLVNKFSVTVNYEDLSLTEIQVPLNPVLFLDELQRINEKPFNASSRMQVMIERPQAQVIWELLGNNGLITVESPTQARLDLILSHPEMYLPMPQDRRFNLDEKEEEFLKTKMAYQLEQIRVLKQTLPLQATVDLHRSLIFLAANLDNVFIGSSIVDPEMYSANDLHRRTSKITPSNIREGLLNLFRPEQVSRIGSRYVVFPTLSELAFREFINKKLEEIRIFALDHYNINIEFTEAFKERIYQEGVIPSQGIRPLVQTIETFAKDPLSKVYAFKSAKRTYAGNRKIKVRADVTDHSPYSTWVILNGPFKENYFEFTIPSEYLLSLQLRKEPERSIVAVRLAARILLGISFHGKLPRLVRTNSRIGGKDGVIDFDLDDYANGDQQLFYLRDYHLKKLSTLLASYVAEKMVFGSNGMASQYQMAEATEKAMLMAGQSGMSKYSIISNVEILKRGHLPDEVEELLQEAQTKTRLMIEKEKNFFARLIDVLHQNVILGYQDVLQIFTQEWTDKQFIQQVLGRDSVVFSETLQVKDLILSPDQFNFFNFDKNDERKIGF